jgi:hypothetical protein
VAQVANRTSPLGFYGDFGYAQTNRDRDNRTCEGGDTATAAGYVSVGGQPQIAWMEGQLKLWGCRNSTTKVRLGCGGAGDTPPTRVMRVGGAGVAPVPV